MSSTVLSAFVQKTFNISSILLKKNLDIHTSYCRIFCRHLRGSRFSKELNAEDAKYQRLVKFLKGSSSKEPDASVNENSTHSTENRNVDNNECVDLSKEIESVDPTAENVFEMLEEKITPLKKLPYTRQLERKYKKSLAVLRDLGEKLKASKVPIAFGRDKLPCPVEIAMSSPVTEAYRNKDEFSVGHGADGNPKTVGFYLGSITENPDTFCIGPDDLIIIKDCHKEFVKTFQSYIRQSPLPACTRFGDSGFWKNIIVRSNDVGDLMAAIVIHPQEMTKEELQLEKEKIQNYFSKISNSQYNLKSLYFQSCLHTRCSHEQAPFELLLGEAYITETSNGLKFQVSPDSFFQPNTKGAEVMYGSLLKLCKVRKSTTILDINCGIGPVSLIFSPHVKRTIGIDNCSQSIEDAKNNAKINNLHNSMFFHGPTENLLKEVLASDYYDDLIVVISPSRSELSKTAARCLRESKFLKKIVYISTKPKSALSNFIELSRSPGSLDYLGKSFLPILAVPYDLYPQTEHYGLAVMFQRL